jgi:hypothetical protein
LLLKHAQSDVAIDVILGGLPFEQEAVDRARAHRVGDITVRLPRVGPVRSSVAARITPPTRSG